MISSDVSLIIAGLCTAGGFMFWGTDRLYRFYFGVILGFLLFLVINGQLKLVEMQGEGVVLSDWETFITTYKDKILGFFSIMIVGFGVLFSIIGSELRASKLFNLLFGFLLPIFVLGVLGYVVANSAINLDFLQGYLDSLGNSVIFEAIQRNPNFIFAILVIIILRKYIISFVLILLAYFARLIIEEVNDLRGENEGE